MKYHQKAKDIALSGLLVALMLLLGFIETLIPFPSIVPGIKIGLSNSVLLYALYIFGNRRTFLLMVLKVVLSGLLFGGVSAMMYSLAGGILSVLVMILMRKIPQMGIVGVSVSGAVAHSAGQVLMAMLVLQTDKLFYYMAFLSAISVATGLATGILAGMVLRSLSKLPQ